MEKPHIQEKLRHIKTEHKYETRGAYLSAEIMAFGNNLEEIPAKLKGLRQEIEEYKQFLMKQRSEIYEEIEKFLESKGLPIVEYSGKKMNKTTPKYLSEINLRLSEKFRYNEFTTINEISNMELYIKRSLEHKAKREREEKQKKEELQRHAAILKTAEKWLTPEEIKTATALGASIQQLEMLIKERYTQSMLGQEIGISCCGDCEEYITGEHRCSCGNRRISAEAEGYYSNGEYQLYISTEAY